MADASFHNEHEQALRRCNLCMGQHVTIFNQGIPKRAFLVGLALGSDRPFIVQIAGRDRRPGRKIMQCRCMWPFWDEEMWRDQ